MSKYEQFCWSLAELGDAKVQECFAVGAAQGDVTITTTLFIVAGVAILAVGAWALGRIF